MSVGRRSLLLKKKLDARSIKADQLGTELEMGRGQLVDLGQQLDVRLAEADQLRTERDVARGQIAARVDVVHLGVGRVEEARFDLAADATNA